MIILQRTLTTYKTTNYLGEFHTNIGYGIVYFIRIWNRQEKSDNRQQIFVIISKLENKYQNITDSIYIFKMAFIFLPNIYHPFLLQISATNP